jgi:hypothetical protein
MRDLLPDLLARLRRLPPQRRTLLLGAGCGALAILVVAGSLLALGMRDPTPRTAALVATIAPTSSPTVTLAPSPTHTPKVSHPAPPSTHLGGPPPPPPPTPVPPPATPTATFCPTATTVPPTPTTAPTSTGAAAPTPTSTPIPPPPTASGCRPCPYYAGNNPSQSQIAAALDAAADAYHLPRNLVRATAWQESKWHEDVTSCDGGVGLMQIQYYYASYFNGLAYGACGFSATNYDIYSLQGNADLGAKVLAYLSCYYSFGGPYGGTSGAPANGSSAYYYAQASLAYPDLTKLNGSPNPSSFCAGVYNDPARPQYQALPLSGPASWSCPYSPSPTDSTLLDIVISAYNAGQSAIYNCSCIPNPGYVANVEGFIPQFASGALP